MERSTDFDDPDALLEQARELFRMCDVGNKQFIIRDDLRRLENDLPSLNAEQLEQIFDGLDIDGNGQLTVDEFLGGFANFLGVQTPNAPPGSLYWELENTQRQQESMRSTEAVMAEDQFQNFLRRIGTQDSLGEENNLKSLWMKLRDDDPQLLVNFEGFLTTVADELEKKNQDFVSLENIMRQRNFYHEDKIRKMYDEMEMQIRLETERILNREQQKVEKMRLELEYELSNKDRQIQEITGEHVRLETEFKRLNDIRAQTEQEKETLRKEREDFHKSKTSMEQELSTARESVRLKRQQLDELKKQSSDERQARAKAIFKVTENIASEREGLVKQLQLLRSVNRQLTDERDELRSLPSSSVSPRMAAKSLASTMRNGCPERVSSPETGGKYTHIIDDPLGSRLINDEEEDEEEYEDQLRKSLYRESHALQLGQQTSLMNELGAAMAMSMDPAASMNFQNGHGYFEERVEPLGGNEKVNPLTTMAKHEFREAHTPDRIFKVVFVGDSGVGKTCFLHRFCHDRFTPKFSATIGVDFQVKTLRVEDRLVALQLWDTAGQERFRSLTKQYFRKADGIVLMYDVTSELSFLNLRSWIQSVKEGVEEDCVLCLIGNKIDLFVDESSRVLKFRDGQKLADEYGALFYEVSTHNGIGVRDSMLAMAALLREREDAHLEKALQLEMEVQQKKSGCCGTA